MNFLKKLATPFIALWRWIKETAWVQPLLIVGIIFALIFSIPYITKGFEGLVNKSNEHMTYFESSLISLENCKNNEGNSDAEHFFTDFMEAQDAWENGNKDEAKNILSSYSNGGERFFLFFVQEDCEMCSTLKNGLEELLNNWDLYVTDYYDEDIPSLEYRSINCASTFDNDSYYKDNNTTPIKELTTSTSFLAFHRIAMSVVDNTDYYFNLNKLKDSGDASDTQNSVYSNTEALIDATKLQTPTSILIDLTDDNQSRYLIKEVFYQIPTTAEASDETKRFESAEFLRDAWTKNGVFSASYN